MHLYRYHQHGHLSQGETRALLTAAGCFRASIETDTRAWIRLTRYCHRHAPRPLAVRGWWTKACLSQVRRFGCGLRRPLTKRVPPQRQTRPLRRLYVDKRLKNCIMKRYAMNGRVRAHIRHREPRQLESGAKNARNMVWERFCPIGRAKRKAPIYAVNEVTNQGW